MRVVTTFTAHFDEPLSKLHLTVEDYGAALQRDGEFLGTGRGVWNMQLPNAQDAGAGEARGWHPSCCFTPGVLEGLGGVVAGGGDQPHAAGTKPCLAGQQKKVRWCADLGGYSGPQGTVGGEGGGVSGGEAGVAVLSRQEQEGGCVNNREQARKEPWRQEKYSRTSSTGHNQKQEQQQQQQHRSYGSDPGGDSGDSSGGVKDYCRGRFQVHEALLYGPLPQRKGAAVAPPRTPVARAGPSQQGSMFGGGSTDSITQLNDKVKNAASAPAADARTGKEEAVGSVTVSAVVAQCQGISRAQPSADGTLVLSQQEVGTLPAAAVAAGPVSPSYGLPPAPVPAVSAVQVSGTSGSYVAERRGPLGSAVAERGGALSVRGCSGANWDGLAMGTPSAAAAAAAVSGVGVGGAVQLPAVQQPETPATAVEVASHVAVVNFKVGRFTVRQELQPNSRASSRPSSPKGDQPRPQISKLGSLKQEQGTPPRASNNSSSSSRPRGSEGDDQRQQQLGKVNSWKQQQQQQQFLHVQVQQEQFSSASTLSSSSSSRLQQQQQQQLSNLSPIKQQGWLESSTTHSTSRKSSIPGNPPHEGSHPPTAASRLGSLKKMGRVAGCGGSSSSSEGAAAAAFSGMRIRHVGRFIVTDQPVLLAAGSTAPVVNMPSSSCNILPALTSMTIAAPPVTMGSQA